MPSTEIVIASARRTPLGAFQGALSALSAPQLGAAALKGALDAAGIEPAAIDEVILGCVLAAGLGQAPARQAAIAAGIPFATPATTINKMCGSGLKAVMMAADQIAAGGAEIVLAGGFESMTRAPYLLPKARSGYRMGHGEIIDHMFLDGLQSPFDNKLMGCFADATATRYGLTREQQDTFAAESVRRALRAQARDFDAEIVAVSVKDRKSERTVTRDEIPATCDLDKIPTLRPAFRSSSTRCRTSTPTLPGRRAACCANTRDTAWKARYWLPPLCVSTAARRW